MAEFYKGNNRKMMTHDSFSTSHEEILYMEKLPATPNPVSYDGETKPKVSAVGRKQQFPQSNSANFAVAKKLSIVHCALLIAFCFLFAGNAWADERDLLTEGFDSFSSISTSYSASGWYAYNAGSGNNWTLNTSSTYAHSGSKSAQVQYNSSYAANCYLVSAPFTVSSNMAELSVSLYERVRSSTYAETFEVFFVKASDVTNAAAVVSATKYNAISSTSYTNESYATKSGSVTSSALAGQSVRLVIHCTSIADRFYLYIDDIKVTETYTVPPYAAEWIADGTVIDASDWCIGETRTVTLQVKNTGTATWYNSTANGGDGSGNQTDHDMVAVSYKWDEDEWYDSHPNTRNHFDHNIAPGETATITFNVEGPRKSGANHLRFNLIRQECCWFSYQNNCSNALEKVVDVTVPALTLSASNSVICNGGSSTLTTNCNITANIYTSEPYIWDWNTSSYTGNNHITEASVDRSILKFKTTGNDPMINMYSIGSFNPSVYKYVRMKYRIVEGSNPGSVEIFFVSSTGANTGGATTGYSRSTSLNADHQWHIAEINMSAHASWVANGNVTGWRLDPCGSSNTIKMEIDWIGLFPDPIATNVSTYTATPSQTTTYYACNYVENRPYIHTASQTVTVATNPTVEIAASLASTECIASGTALTFTASPETFNVRKGSFSSIASSGTAVTFSGQDDGGVNVPIGFNFNYNGTNYDNVYACTNGFLIFGTTSTAYSNNLSGTSNILAPFWDDLDSYSTTSGWYKLSGSDHNRVLTYEQYCYAHHSYTSSTIRYQVKLYEGSNIIEFCYGPDFPANSSSDCSASIGISYTEGGSIKFVSVTPTGDGAATTSTATANNNIGTAACDYITSGTIYKFTPILSFDYSWTASGTSGSASGTGNNTYTVSPAALTNTYTASVTNSGCSAQASTTITTKPTVTVSSSTGNSDACDGSDVLLTATSNATDFVWSNNAGTEPVVTVHPRSATTYYVTASSATCTNAASISVNVKASPTLTASPDIYSTCFDGSTQVVLTAGGAANVESILINEGFENSGALPSDWTISTTGSNNWSALTAVCSGNTPYDGSYVVGTGNGTDSRSEEMYIITPAMDLSNAVSATLHFYYCNKNWVSDTDPFGVYYRIGTSGSWNQLLYTSDAHTGWTEQTINLTGLAANYQIGFYRKDNYGYGAGIDNVKVTALVSPTYSWSSTGTSGSASGTTYTVTPSEGTNTYTVSVDGCSRSITIDVLTANNITASGETTDCGVPVTLSASGIEGATYDWYDGNTLVQANSPSFTPTDIINGKTYNVKVSKEIYGDVYEDVRTFTYTGTVQSVTIPEGAVAAKLEVWGAQGGYRSASSYGGKGGYSVGTISSPTIGQTLYVVVGGSGNTGGTSGGYNGGGNRDTYNGGGGATHIANAAPSGSNYQLRYYSSTSDQQKILVVAGGGGSDGASTNSGGYGGGTTGGAGSGSWGTATAGGFGYGAKGVYQSSGYGGAGGGGWSGGSGITADTSSDDDKGGSGGSGYVNTSLIDAETIAGNSTMPNPTGGTMTGREGNGYARITFYIQNHITCASQPKQVALTVTPLTTPVAQDKTICPGNTASLSVQSPVSGYTYHWGAGSDTGTGNSFTTVSLDNTTTYQITATKAFDEIVAAYDFDYSGEMQEVEAPSDADYAILEVWGAEGGGSKANLNSYPIGGKGGYAKGKMEVSSGQHFYVVVGGKGQDAVLGPGAAVVTALGGYNGGGGGTSDNEGTSAADREAAGGGGGATHIAKAAPSSGTDYQLYYYSSNQDDVLLVAGGGGGASYTQTGGYGGGTAGGRVSSGGSGGAQTARVSSGTQVAGVFGRGANASGNGNGYGNGVGGGGGGWYGGNVNTVTNKNYNSGGGGSGHINTSLLTNTTILAGNKTTIPNIAGTGTETGHSGNGHARIVFYKNGGGECVSSVANVDAIVNKPSVGTLTFTPNQDIDICPGTAVTLQVTSANPTASEGLSYVWKKGSTTLGTSSSLEVTAEATYNVKVTATNIVNGKTCTADQSQNIAVTYKKPSAEELTDMGAVGGCYIWTGKSDDWSTDNNWMKYSTSNGGTYTLTATPNASATVAVGKYNTCVSGSSPTLNINEPALAKIFKVGTGVTVSGSSTLTVGGTLTNKGTLNAPLVITGALDNSGTVNSSLTLNGTYTLTNNGTLNAPAVFNGVTTLAGSGSTTFSSVTINSGKTLKTSSHNITISGDCTNNGIFTAGAGSITMTGNLANNGTFTASTGAITMTGNLTNSGTFNGAGGTISITGNLTNASTFKTVAGALSLNGNLTNSGTFTIGGAGAVTLTGNWTNNGTFTPTGTGAVIFAGTSSQVIGGTNATTFKNVQFNNSANSLSISNEPTITGTATFSSGVVSGNVTLGSAATVSGAGTSSYINGKVTKVMNADATFKFPIGTASLYAPFEAKSSAASNVSVQYASGSEDMPDWWNHSGNFSNVGLDHASDRENWQVSASATTNLSAIKLYWNTAAGNYHSFEEGADALESYLRIAAVKKNSFYWQNLGQSAIEGDFDGAGSITAATPLAITVGAKAAGDDDYFVTFASTNKGNLLLPIELTSFTATCDGRSTLVEWTTATEKNNDYFSLERSDDAINFTEITRVAGAGNSIEPIDYSYTDYGIHGGDNYYRLVQVDYDGTRTASEIIVTNCVETAEGEPDVQAYPNPFNDELTVVLDNFGNRAATIEVYDMLGKLIYTNKIAAPQNSYETILNLSNLPPAAYTVRVSTTDFVINRNVVKQ